VDLPIRVRFRQTVAVAGQPSARVRVRRAPRRARYDRESIYRVLDRERVAHVAFTTDGGEPFCIPTLYARVGDELLIHGSRASRMIRRLATGAPACVAVTILDGLVLARSVFEHTANYDSVIVLGSFREIDEDQARLAALEAFTDALVPGRWAEVRPPSRKELKATAILGLALDEASVKTRDAPPDDDGDGNEVSEIWTGVLPIIRTYGEPCPSPGLDPRAAPVPRSVARLLAPQSANGSR
jgi:uncharacterized protein